MQFLGHLPTFVLLGLDDLEGQITQGLFGFAQGRLGFGALGDLLFQGFDRFGQVRGALFDGLAEGGMGFFQIRFCFQAGQAVMVPLSDIGQFQRQQLQVALVGVFDNVIVHAGLEGVHRQVLRTGAGQHDKGRQVAALAQLFVGCQAGDARQVLVHHHDVEGIAAGLHGRGDFLGLHTDGHIELQAGLIERPFERNLIVGAVLNKQNANRCCLTIAIHGIFSGISTSSQKSLIRRTIRDRSAKFMGLTTYALAPRS